MVFFHKINKTTWFKVVSLVIIQSFLFTNISLAASLDFDSKTESNYLSPTLSVQDDTVLDVMDYFSRKEESIRIHAAQKLVLIPRNRLSLKRKDFLDNRDFFDFLKENNFLQVDSKNPVRYYFSDRFKTLGDFLNQVEITREDSYLKLGVTKEQFIKLFKFANKIPHDFIDENGAYHLLNYDSEMIQNFAGFIPTIAGYSEKAGIGYWTNDGQLMKAFGSTKVAQFPLKPKGAIDAFLQRIFRTFMKIHKDGKEDWYEPFSKNALNTPFDTVRKMIIEKNGTVVRLEEINYTLNIKVSTEYVQWPNKDYFSLLKGLEVESLDDEPMEVQVVDGMYEMEAYNEGDGHFSHRHTASSMWKIQDIGEGTSVIRPGQQISDVAVILPESKGNFVHSFREDDIAMDIITDPRVMFSGTHKFEFPDIPTNFLKVDAAAFGDEVANSQIKEGFVPSAMAYTTLKFDGTSKKKKIFTMLGQVDNDDQLRKLVKEDANVATVNAQKKYMNEYFAKRNTVVTCSNNPMLDAFNPRMALDNGFRAGHEALTFKDIDGNGVVFLKDLAKHADLERDYNLEALLLPAEKIFQGDFNWRDGFQSALTNIFFKDPDIGDAFIREFLSLLQMDGFNPLNVKQKVFSYDAVKGMGIMELLSDILPDENNREQIKNFIEGKIKEKNTFTIGEILKILDDAQMRTVGMSNEEFNDVDLRFKKYIDVAKKIVSQSHVHYVATHKEGYWSDHWTYAVTMIELYLKIYPEKRKELLNSEGYKSYQSEFYVAARKDKTVYEQNVNMVMQEGAVKEDKKVKEIISQREKDKNPDAHFVHTNEGKVFTQGFINKFMSIVSNKMASMDQSGLGVEMESDKPNWYDAINGAPGVFGSSTAETMDLLNWVEFLLDSLNEDYSDKDGFVFDKETAEFLMDLSEALSLNIKSGISYENNYKFWGKSHDLKEAYWERTRYGVSSGTVEVGVNDLKEFLRNSKEKLEFAIDQSYDSETGIYQSYYLHEAPFKYDNVSGLPDANLLQAYYQGEEGNIRYNEKGNPLLEVPNKPWNRIALSPFLAGQVGALRIMKGEVDSNDFEGIVSVNFQDSQVVLADLESNGYIKYDEATGKYKIQRKFRELPDHRSLVLTKSYIEAQEEIYNILLNAQRLKAKALYESVKNSVLYDKNLQRFKVNAGVEKFSEKYPQYANKVGRYIIFPDGWLEGQSIWTHMDYKFLLELVKSGLYDEFFTEIKTNVPAFMDVLEWQRIITQLGSFSVASSHPDKRMHGTAQYAQSSGGCTEWLTILIELFMGGKMSFTTPEGKLRTKVAPIIPGEWFTENEQDITIYQGGKEHTVKIEEHSFATQIYANTLMVIRNPDRLDTYDLNTEIQLIEIKTLDGSETLEYYQDDMINAASTKKLRSKGVERIDLYIGKKATNHRKHAPLERDFDFTGQVPSNSVSATSSIESAI